MSLATIRRWRAYIPDEPDAGPRPMLCVDPVTDAEYALADDDCGQLQSFIWYRDYDRRSRAAAQRIAQELATLGVAFVYPGDRVRVQVGRRHHLIVIGDRA